jgi:capsular polysaccharide export protein
MPAAPRRFLLLQGPVGPFFALLARRLRDQGHQVTRILFNGGDRLFAWGPGAVSYRGQLAGWPAFLDQQLRERSVTDIVLFGDCRPLHREAVAQARRHGIAVHVLEEGYLRPHWLTLERGGVNGYSSLPRDPRWYRDEASALPVWQPPTRMLDSLAFRIAIDMLYRLATFLGAPRYPGYRTHRPWHPLAEYGAGARGSLLWVYQRWRSRRHATRIIAGDRPWFVFPLQLEADSQIRFHSPTRSMLPAIHDVVTSFARSAPADSLLVVTEHPLDTHMVDLAGATRAAAEASGVEDRVLFLRGGSPTELLRGCHGIVTINSTIGFRALALARPLKALGKAVYDLPGLTFQGSLDDFWRRAQPPDESLFDAFRRVLAARTQINAGLYSPSALGHAASRAAARLAVLPPAVSTALPSHPGA